MYKTAVYTLVNGAITHQKPQINVTLHSTLPKCQCTAEQFHIFIFAVYRIHLYTNRLIRYHAALWWLK